MKEYTSLAKYYDLIHASIDYEGQAKHIHRLVQTYKRSKENKLLDAGCGTGTHITFLEQHYTCTGIDKSKEMISQAKSKTKTSTFNVEDIHFLDFKGEYDVVTCLFNTINSLSCLDSIFHNFYQALKPGGVAIIQAYHDKDTRLQNFHQLRFFEHEDIKLARIARLTREGNTVTFNFNYLISEKDKPLISLIDEEEAITLFSKEDILASMEQARFQACHYREDLQDSFFIGVR